MEEALIRDRAVVFLDDWGNDPNGQGEKRAFTEFLADFPRAITITDAYPFREITDWLKVHRHRADAALATLAYFDSSTLALHARVPGDFTVGLMDLITPPSTVFAAYNAWAGEKDMTVWSYNGHEGGGLDDFPRELAFLRKHLA